MPTLTDWFKQLQQPAVGGTFGTGAGSTAAGALGNWRTILPQFSGAAGMGTAAALPVGMAGLTHMVQRGLPEELKGKGGLFDTSTAVWGGMGAGAGIDPEVDKILRANAIFSGNKQVPVEETVTDQWTLPQTDLGPVKPTEPQPQRGKLDMFLQKFGVPPMTQVSDADRTANKQFMQEQGIGVDNTGRMTSGDFIGQNLPGKSGWGSANFGEMAQNWVDKFGDVEYSDTVHGRRNKAKQDKIKKAAEDYALTLQEQERIEQDKTVQQPTITSGGDRGTFTGPHPDTPTKSPAEGGWHPGVAQGGYMRSRYNQGGRVGILSVF